MVLGDDSLAHDRADDRRAEQLGQLGDGRASIERAATNVDQRLGCIGQQVRRLCDLLAMGDGRYPDASDGASNAPGLGQQIERKLDVDRAGRP